MADTLSTTVGAMEGAGFYNRNSSMQAAGNATALALWERAATGTVHLGWNSWTMQWMSQNTVEAPDHVFPLRSKVPDVRAAVIEILDRDWRRFLTLRSIELRAGGRLLCIFPGSPPEKMGWEWLTGERWGAVCDMRSAGLLTDGEVLHINVPTGPRPLGNIVAPFAAGGQFAGLAIEHMEILQGPDIHWHDFEQTGDADKLAKSWAGMMRAFSGPTILNCIDPARNRAELVDELFDRLTARLRANPQRHEHFLAVLLLHKVSPVA